MALSELITEVRENHRHDDFSIDNALLQFVSTPPTTTRSIEGARVKGVFKANRAPLQASFNTFFAHSTRKISAGILGQSTRPVGGTQASNGLPSLRRRAHSLSLHKHRDRSNRACQREVCNNPHPSPSDQSKKQSHLRASAAHSGPHLGRLLSQAQNEAVPELSDRLARNHKNRYGEIRSETHKPLPAKAVSRHRRQDTDARQLM